MLTEPLDDGIERLGVARAIGRLSWGGRVFRFLLADAEQGRIPREGRDENSRALSGERLGNCGADAMRIVGAGDKRHFSSQAWINHGSALARLMISCRFGGKISSAVASSSSNVHQRCSSVEACSAGLRPEMEIALSPARTRK